MLEYDIEFTRGDTFYFGFETIDLTDEVDEAYFTCRQTKDKTSPIIFQKSLEDGITFLNDGDYRVRIAPTDTKDLDLGRYYYDVELTKNGDVYTPIKGQLSLTYDITRN